MRYSRILFICNDNTALGPMAENYMRWRFGDSCVIFSRGLVVLYSEPYNPKIYRILGEENIEVMEGQTRIVGKEDFNSHTLVLTMDTKQKQYLYDNFVEAIHVYTIKEFALRDNAGDPDIKEPYGHGIEAYRETFVTIRKYLDIIYDILTRDT